MIFRVILSLIIVFILVGFLCLKYHPVFGRKTSKDKIHEFKQSINFAGKRFINQIPSDRARIIDT